MKKPYIIIMVALALLLCAGCGEKAEDEPMVLATLVDNGAVSIVENGVWVKPGDTATFHVELKSGEVIDNVDYSGEYRVSRDRGYTRIDLLNVKYPVRAKVQISSYNRTITYDPNGGERLDGGTGAVSLNYSVSLHPRPNTSRGTDIIARDGFVLTGWNTEPDGSGARVGLGSRVEVPYAGLTLYAMWEKWNEAEDFSCSLYERTETVNDVETSYTELAVTGYSGSDDKIVIPETINGMPVTKIASLAFRNAPAETVILPKSIMIIEDGAFDSAKMHNLYMYDNVETMSDESFRRCEELRTLYLNAIEDPYGYSFRRESVFADKIDMLWSLRGQKKVVFYAGCSAWYNLDGKIARESIPEDYAIIDMAVNGVMNSYVQMRIIEAYLEEGDIFFHAPEIASHQQMINNLALIGRWDDKFWCGIEYNYDLFTLVDCRDISGIFGSLKYYWDKKKPGGGYTGRYQGSNGYYYLDEYGCIDFERVKQADKLVDSCVLETQYIQSGLPELHGVYDDYMAKGVRVYVSSGPINIDNVPEEERGNLYMMEELYNRTFRSMKGVRLISKISDYVYHNEDFYDTNYHMLSEPARENTRRWMADLKAAMEADGLR